MLNSGLVLTRGRAGEGQELPQAEGNPCHHCGESTGGPVTQGVQRVIACSVVPSLLSLECLLICDNVEGNVLGTEDARETRSSLLSGIVEEVVTSVLRVMGSYPLSSLEDDTSIQRTMYSTQLASSFISHFQV